MEIENPFVKKRFKNKPIAPLSRADHGILSVLQESGEMTPKEIYSDGDFGVTERQIYNRLRHLEEEGVVTNNGGRFSLNMVVVTEILPVAEFAVGVFVLLVGVINSLPAAYALGLFLVVLDGLKLYFKM